jgi:hypothetical protein
MNCDQCKTPDKPSVQVQTPGDVISVVSVTLMVGNYSTHINIANASIEDGNKSMLHEIEQLAGDNHDLKEQTEKEKVVLGKVCAIQREFAQRKNADREQRREGAVFVVEHKRRAEADALAYNLPKMGKQP